MAVSSSKLQETVEKRWAWVAALHGVPESQTRLNNKQTHARLLGASNVLAGTVNNMKNCFHFSHFSWEPQKKILAKAKKPKNQNWENWVLFPGQRATGFEWDSLGEREFYAQSFVSPESGTLVVPCDFWNRRPSSLEQSWWRSCCGPAIPRAGLGAGSQVRMGWPEQPTPLHPVCLVINRSSLQDGDGWRWET